MENTPTAHGGILTEKSDWLVAAIFFVTAGFIAPWVVGVIAMNLYFAGGSEYLSKAGLGGSSIGLIITCIAIYLTTLYVAKFIKRRYLIRSPKRIALIAAGYFIFILVPWYSYEYLAGINEAGLQGAVPMLMLFRFLTFAIFAYTLYSSVRKHLLTA